MKDKRMTDKRHEAQKAQKRLYAQGELALTGRDGSYVESWLLQGEVVLTWRVGSYKEALTNSQWLM